ncbi:gliding motility-associated C-terminal domain-containing protein [uncultured Polaribacter sp.]|uniref:gliding motility-associated C-terminal domain-containing protein n=1 Tax=uncultured Polaribacter sp. TaxID=174711 RepID=UPI00261B5DDB|nr:gliding motility-associated C-terminal domain-containing protein [uncultured Polaribacter sp.]
MKKLLFFCFVCLSSIQTIFAQCNPPVTVNGIIDCAIDEPTVSVLFAMGDLGNEIRWFDAQFGGNQLAPTDPLQNGFTYWAEQTDGTCLSERSSTTVVLEDPGAPIVLESLQTFCEADQPTIANLAVQLKSATNSVLWYPSATAVEPLNATELLVDQKSYWASELQGLCESIGRVEVFVELETPPEPTTTSATQTFCENDINTVADLQATGEGIQWYASETSTTPLPFTQELIDNTTYYATQTPDAIVGCESATRLEVLVELTAVPEPTTNATTQEFCENEVNTVADLQVNETNIIWYATATSVDALDNVTPLVTGTYYATQAPINSCESATRLEVTVVLNEAPEPTTNSTIQTFCESDVNTIADLQANEPNIRWYATPTSTIALDAAEELVAGNYYATQITGNINTCESDTRLEVSVVIETVPEPTTVSAIQTFCENDINTVANLQATGTGIQWYSSATAPVALNPTDELIDGNIYYATQTPDATTGCESATRLEVLVTFDVAPEPTTSSTTQSFCENDINTVADLQATGTGIQWYSSATATVPLNSTDILEAKNYYATQTAGESCESNTRLEVTVVLDATQPPTTTSTSQSFCDNELATIADLNITGTTIRWYDTETSTEVLNNTDLLTTGDYYATQTIGGVTGCESEERTRVDVIVVSTAAPTTNGPTQVFCNANNAIVSNLIALEPNVQWYESETSTVALNPTEVLVDGEDYYATQEANPALGCANLQRAMVTVIIGEIPPAPTTSIIGTQAFCGIDAPTLDSLDVNETSLRWYDSANSTIPLENTTSLVDGASYFATQVSANGCESETRLEISVTVTGVELPSLSVENAEEFCLLNGDYTLSDLNDRVVAPLGTTIVWYDDVYPAGNVIDLSEPLITGNIYYAYSEDVEGCKSLIPLILPVNLEACSDDDLGIFDGFSPNDDGINDVYNTDNLLRLFPDYTITFYNRWGNIVYEGGADKDPWNGKLKGSGELLPQGVYFYSIDFKNNDRKPKQGTVYLSR